MLRNLAALAVSATPVTLSLAALAAVALFAAGPAARADQGRAEGRTEGLPRLATQGIRFVDPRGVEVPLRGINLGSWLLQEMWMTPVVQDPPAGSALPKIDDHVTFYKVIEERLGRDAARNVLKAWRNAWLQESDFDRIKAAGFNHVRLPILWSVVEEPGGLDRIRQAVAWANARGLYVILDMHGLPGSQSGDHTTGQANVNKFFYDPVNIARGEKVWATVARAFGKNPGVAAFDLINEPTGTPNPATLFVVYNRLYQVIRKAAPETIIIMDDGYKGFDTTPHPNVTGWTNVAYTLHFYHFDAPTSEDHVKRLQSILPRILELRGYRNVPVYIGEFQVEPHGTPATMETYIRTLTENGLSWAMWTYKTVARGGEMGYWGLYRNTGPADALNPFEDSEARLIEKIGQVRTERLAPNAELLAVFQRNLAS